jgi:hypothetical protein
MSGARYTLPPEIDAAVPYSGPCGLCGGIEARHRVLDAIAERVRAGEPVADVAEDYGKTEAVVAAIAACWDYDRERWTT